MSGAREHFLQYYNYMDFCILALYLASYSLRFATQYRLTQANRWFNATERAEEALGHCDSTGNCTSCTQFMAVINETKDTTNEKSRKFAYFMDPCKWVDFVDDVRW